MLAEPHQELGTGACFGEEVGATLEGWGEGEGEGEGQVRVRVSVKVKVKVRIIRVRASLPRRGLLPS